MTVYIKKLSLGGGDVIGQGPLKIWTENFSQSHFMKIHLREDCLERSILWSGYFGQKPFIILQDSDQDLSNEETKFILKSLKVGHCAAPTWQCFHKLWIKALRIWHESFAKID